MRTGAGILLSLSSALLLAGCDVIEKIPLTPTDALEAGDLFGLTTRELVEETPEGKVYRLMVESRRPASWSQAGFFMMKQLRDNCPDGEPYTTLSTEPARGASMEELNRKLPAGTTFIHTVRCEPKPYYEFEFERRLPHRDAYGAMVRRLSDAAPGTKGRMYVQPILPSEQSSKYEQLEKAFGVMVVYQMAECPAGVVLTHPQLGMFPLSDPAREWHDPAGYLGFVYECAADPAAGGAADADSSN